MLCHLTRRIVLYHMGTCIIAPDYAPLHGIRVKLNPVGASMVGMVQLHKWQEYRHCTTWTAWYFITNSARDYPMDGTVL